MKHTVPIYMANVLIRIVEKTGKNSRETRLVKLQETIVKGFTLPDIAKRKQSLADKFVKNKFKETAKIVGIELISQHGYGIDD